MNKTLLTTTLAIIGSFVVGSSALAAPSVAFKKQLSVPTVPTTVINQVKALSWRYTTDKGTRYKPVFATFTKVAVKPPVLVNEKDCSDVIYRVWEINLDIGAMRKTHPNLVPYVDYEGYYDTSEPAKYVMEARTPTAVKWQIDPKADSAYYPDSILSCKGKDLIIENSYVGEAATTGKFLPYEIRNIPFASFTNNDAWKVKPFALPQARSYTRDTVDGIFQFKGVLTVHATENSPLINGDSRITTVEEGKGVHVHTVPRYRDFATATLREKEIIDASFYRLKDGYAVVETSSYRNGNTYKYETTYYRIRNGEAQYSIVQSLPFNPNISFDTYDKGLVVAIESTWRQTAGARPDYKAERGLIHGLNAGHNVPTAVYKVQTKILWETDSQIYIRYLVTDKHTKKQQYWEAIVNKK